MNVTAFLSSGETTLYSARSTKVLAFAGPMMMALSLSTLVGCAGRSTPDGIDLVANASMTEQPVAHLAIDGMRIPIDSHTLLYQAIADPSASKVRAASGSSQFLSRFLQSLPGSIKTEAGRSLTEVDAADLAHGLEKTLRNGQALVSKNTQYGPDACVIMTRWLDQGMSTADMEQEVVSMKDSLYAATVSRTMAMVAVHEATHCYPFTAMKPPTTGNPLDLGYYSSLQELRSDLAVVLYTASRTGSFDEGIASVGALRANGDPDYAHSDFGMLKLLSSSLNPLDYKGLQLGELAEMADSIVNQASLENNAVLRKAFAKEAWIGQSIFINRTASVFKPAPPAFAAFAGEPFAIDAREVAKDFIDSCLENALYSADSVRASRAITPEKVKMVASYLGRNDLTNDQVAKVMFLDAAITPLGTMQNADGSVRAKPSSLNLQVLSAAAQSTLKTMARTGVLISAVREAATPHQEPLSARLEAGMVSLQAKVVNRTSSVPKSKFLAP